MSCHAQRREDVKNSTNDPRNNETVDPRQHPIIIYLGMAVASFVAGWLVHEAILPAVQICKDLDTAQKEIKSLEKKLEVSKNLNSIVSAFNSGDREGWTAFPLQASLMSDSGSSEKGVADW
ncbi:MAG: LapA family protein [Okeania sp. SIO2D1]|nr:LapA family protein [Okeania sp. SIO2D1]